MTDAFVSILGKPYGIVLAQLLTATQYTIYLTLIAFLGGGLIGAVVATAKITTSRTARTLASGYIWLFQSVPLLMLLFLLGLGVPRLIGMNINSWLAASIALTLYASAYLSEVWAGAVNGVAKGQWEAGFALGLRFRPVLWTIIAPQALRLAIAPTVGFMVQIIKGTSLAYIIGFHDLMTIGRRWANAPVPGTEPFVIFPLMALIYFCLCFPLSKLSRRLERRLGAVHGADKTAAG
ncbi:amino acid ABC transporter permease [Acuticoccus sediminis]|uniref:amino acid ABC transporter permease n=1 Tax=Acuticoccus sediminis TaxID=2184697 RepID=UPI001CFD01D4|nr:amino acid ABC transporter permease [Acuticoccus sediminis]